MIQLLIIRKTGTTTCSGNPPSIRHSSSRPSRGVCAVFQQRSSHWVRGRAWDQYSSVHKKHAPGCSQVYYYLPVCWSLYFLSLAYEFDKECFPEILGIVLLGLGDTWHCHNVQLTGPPRTKYPDYAQTRTVNLVIDNIMSCCVYRRMRLVLSRKSQAQTSTTVID